MLREIWDAIVRVVFGNNAIDNAKDWKQSHDKAEKSRQDLADTVKNIMKKG